ncbi:colicin E5-related ribonuclease (plasmid) [Rhizobium beringeri]|nr:colicin E5-related ribonuclease [Rhizobium beringeri]
MARLRSSKGLPNAGRGQCRCCRQWGKIVIDSKIGNQLQARGWTEQELMFVIGRGSVGSTTDNRSAAKTPDGLPRNDMASVYGSKSGYVVVNDRTGEVVQVSGKNDPGWIPDSRIKWK